MKRTFLLLLSVIVSMVMMADGITAERAEEIARQFVNSQQPAAQGRQMRMAAKRQLPMNVAVGTNAYYVFNIGSDNGFVMVSGSDLTPQVLGYADKGSFDMENMPANMKVWLDSYADQIAYVERTMGTNQAPMLRVSQEPIEPMLFSTWDQGAPYNNKCPIINGEGTATGCVATALAQVINYYRYPDQTTKTMPAYTTETYGVSVPEIPVTDIDWDNMLDDYRGGATTAQENAVATLMRLCGQALQTDYCISSDGGSGADMVMQVRALREYFGYDKSVRHLFRIAFSASEWENIIYDELANNRPVLYGGMSMGGGHGFVVDGYYGDGLFHINWGWSGNSDGYFLLSVLNPYNNEAIGSSSSNDGYSFDQEIVVGIQHGTGEVEAERLTAYNIANGGASSYTRTSAAKNFSGMSINVLTYNITSEKHKFWTRLALMDGSGNFVGWATDEESYHELKYLSGSTDYFTAVSFGANLADGDYYITPVSCSENSVDWEPCWRSNIYRIKATIKGNKLTLTAPTVSLSAKFSPIENAQQYATVNVQAEITNTGTDFNNYLYLAVDNTLVGGRMFEAKAGETATFDIDFMPMTSGTMPLTLYYMSGNDYVPFATVSIIVAEDAGGEPLLTGNITITNANSQGNVEGTTVDVTATFQNIGEGAFVNNWIYVVLYKYNPVTKKWESIDYQYRNATIVVGGSTTFTTSFANLEIGGKYILELAYKNVDGTAIYLEETDKKFKVIEPSAPTQVVLPTTSQPFDVYTTTGAKVKHQVTSLNGLPRGIYIVNKKTVLVR